MSFRYSRILNQILECSVERISNLCKWNSKSKWSLDTLQLSFHQSQPVKLDWMGKVYSNSNSSLVLGVSVRREGGAGSSYYTCPAWPEFRACSRDSACGAGEWCKWWACCDDQIADGQFCLPWVGGRQCQSGHCKENTPDSYWWGGHCKRKRHPHPRNGENEA